MANLPYKTKSLVWIGDSLDSITSFPADVKRTLGSALRFVQNGQTPSIAKPVKEFGSGVYELRDDFDGDTYRLVYIIKLKKAVYVLDAFQKKSKSGKAIPKEVKNRILQRLKQAKAEDKG